MKRRTIVFVWAVLALTALAPLAFLPSLMAREPAKPQIVQPGAPPVMDSPIPPGDEAPPPPPASSGVQLPAGMGYCVTYDGNLVNVPFHHPDASKLDETRASVYNALALVANQLDVKAATETDPGRRQGFARRASRLKAHLVGGAAGVRFAGEAGKRMIVDPGITCTCATLLGDPSVLGPRYACGGACGNCISCG